MFDSPYLSSIHDLDTLTNHLLTTLSSEGRLDNALVVITADHGEGLGRDGEWTHGYYTHDATMKTPLLFVGYGDVQLPTTQEISADRNSSIVDVVPTLLKAIQVDNDRDFDGVDLFENTDEARVVLMESLQPALEYGTLPIFSVTDGERVWHEQEPAQRGWPIQTEEIPLAERQQLEALGYLTPSTSWSEPEVDPLAQDRAELMSLYQSGAVGVLPVDAVRALDSMTERWGALPPISSLMVRLLDTQGLREQADAYTSNLDAGEQLISNRDAETQRLSRLRELIQAALSENPEHESAHHDLGVVLWQLGDIDGAEAHLLESVAGQLGGLDQTQPSSLPTLSALYAATNRPNLALSAIEQLPQELLDDCQYGRLLLLSDRGTEALQPLNRCSDAHGDLSPREVEFLRQANDIGL
jgi:hypothetical protein